MKKAGAALVKAITSYMYSFVFLSKSQFQELLKSIWKSEFECCYSNSFLSLIITAQSW